MTFALALKMVMAAIPSSPSEVLCGNMNLVGDTLEWWPVASRAFIGYREALLPDSPKEDEGGDVYGFRNVLHPDDCLYSHRIADSCVQKINRPLAVAELRRFSLLLL